MPAKSFLPGLGLAFLVAVQQFATVGAIAQNDPWTSVGSAGTVDEDSKGIVVFGGPPESAAVVSVDPAKTGTVSIRYNVVAVDGVFGGDNYAMAVRYRDTGSSSRVIARLKQSNLTTGTVTTLLTFDSNSFASSIGYQTRSIASPCSSILNFSDNAYFIDVDINKNSYSDSPALAMLKVGMRLC